MLGISHVVLHVGLCQAAARLPEFTTVRLQVTLRDRAHHPQLEQTLAIERGTGQMVTAAFNAPSGAYQVRLRVLEYDCAASDYLYILPGHDRVITETLNDGAAAPQTPSYLLAGTIPRSLPFVRPAPVLFDGGAKCDEPAGAPLPIRSTVEYDRDSYYAGISAGDSRADAGAQTMALSLTSLTGAQHYVYLPFPFPIPWDGWPVVVRIDVTQAMMVDLDPQPTTWLLCPRLSLTSSK